MTSRNGGGQRAKAQEFRWEKSSPRASSSIITFMFILSWNLNWRYFTIVVVYYLIIPSLSLEMFWFSLSSLFYFSLLKLSCRGVTDSLEEWKRMIKYNRSRNVINSWSGVKLSLIFFLWWFNEKFIMRLLSHGLEFS